MVENTRKIVFFLDTCLGNSKIAGAMRAMGISVETHDQHFPKNALDIEWIPQIAEKEWIILTKDERIGKNALERQVVARTGLRMFTFTSQQLSGDEMVKIIEKAIIPMQKFNQKSSAPRGGVWKSFARKPLVSIASLYFSPQGAGNYTHTRLKKIPLLLLRKSTKMVVSKSGKLLKIWKMKSIIYPDYPCYSEQSQA